MELPSHPSRTFPYEIEDKIGQGAMGAVYLARETNLQRRVAIKTLRDEFLQSLDERAAREATRRFLQEARAIARLSHRGIVSIYRLGTENGSAFIAMEWLEGHDLEHLLAASAPIELDRAVQWTFELLEAVDTAHRHDIVHRDIKPANIIIQPDEHLKLTDFGVAQVKDSKLVKTQVGSMIGTPLYAAPEQLADSDVDQRADLYSVGVVLFEMLGGVVPFHDTNIVRLVQKIMNEEAPKLRTLNPTIPAQIEAVIERALSKDPYQRFSSAGEMAQALVDAMPAGATSGVGHSSLTTATTMDASSPAQIQQARSLSVKGNSPDELVASVVTSWEPRAIGPTEADRLLNRLMEPPLHADPFSGAAQLGERIFLCSRGLICGAINQQTGQTGDVVYDTLPEQAPATLYPLPDHLDERVVMSLSSLLHPPERTHSGLDTAYTDMIKLYQRLCRQGFDGAIRLEEGDKLAYLMLHKGEPLLDVFSTTWEADLLRRGWRSWIQGQTLTAHVEKRRTSLNAATYRRELQDLIIRRVSESTLDEGLAEPSSTVQSGELRVCPGSLDERSSRGSTIWRDIYESDVNFKLLSWMRTGLESFLRERGRLDGWKYLAGWTDFIDRARLYHQLERPGSSERDHFDLVTFEESDKVLHLGRRIIRCGVEELNLFIDSVETAKRARIKTGDIGGAMLVADEFDDDAVDAYFERVRQKNDSWFFNFQDSMTGYEGFVRMGTRRGFHLLLIQSSGNEFKPILPPPA